MSKTVVTVAVSAGVGQPYSLVAPGCGHDILFEIKVERAMIFSMLLLAIQSDAPPAPATSPRIGVDLPAAWHPTGCPPPQPDADIVVCGKRDAAEQYRVRPLPEKYAPVGGPGIGVDLGKGARGNLYTSSGATIDGKVSKRIMVGVTMPF